MTTSRSENRNRKATQPARRRASERQEHHDERTPETRRPADRLVDHAAHERPRRCRSCLPDPRTVRGPRQRASRALDRAATPPSAKHERSLASFLGSRVLAETESQLVRSDLEARTMGDVQVNEPTRGARADFRDRRALRRPSPMPSRPVIAWSRARSGRSARRHSRTGDRSPSRLVAGPRHIAQVLSETSRRGPSPRVRQVNLSKEASCPTSTRETVDRPPVETEFARDLYRRNHATARTIEKRSTRRAL